MTLVSRTVLLFGPYMHRAADRLPERAKPSAPADSSAVIDYAKRVKDWADAGNRRRP